MLLASANDLATSAGLAALVSAITVGLTKVIDAIKSPASSDVAKEALVLAKRLSDQVDGIDTRLQKCEASKTRMQQAIDTLTQALSAPRSSVNPPNPTPPAGPQTP